VDNGVIPHPRAPTHLTSVWCGAKPRYARCRCIAPALAQAPEATAKAAASTLRTPWGEPDLQGIWTEETDTPLQRPAKYATQEFFTAAQRAELDVQRAGLAGKDQRAERGPRPTSAAPTTSCSCPGSTPACARR
jgi:hypothetical protein